MLEYLLDNFNRALGKDIMRWHRIIDAFRLKYSDVYVCTHQLLITSNLSSHSVPGGFIVWKIGLDKHRCVTFDSNPRPAGTYVVQLFPSQEATTEFFKRQTVNGSHRALYTRNAGKAGDNTVMTGFGVFGYDGSIGELTPKFGDGFYQLVLEEDSQRYSDMGNRVR